MHQKSILLQRSGSPLPASASYVLSSTSSFTVSLKPTASVRGFLLIFRISGRGMMEPEAPSPLDTLTLVPSSKYFIPTLHGIPETGSSICTLET
eukprot:Gb_25186 [translate_table: standard]